MTLAEYMRELILMKRQYGQEEELYPLINMLLRYIQDENENDDKKKNDNLKENMKQLSLRQVAKAERIKDDETRNLMMGYESFPDYAILDEGYGLKDNKIMYGCVEAKAVSEQLFEIDNGSFTIYSSDLVQIAQKANKKKSRGKRSTYYYTLSKEIGIDKKIETVELKANENEITIDGGKVYTFAPQKITDENKKKLNIKTNIKGLTDLISNKKTIWHKSNEIGDDITRKKSNLPFIEAYLNNIAQGDIVEIKVFPGGGLTIVTGGKKTEDGGEKGLGQLISELLWYGKVLYTNGLIWKYIELKTFPELDWDKEDEGKEEDRIKLYNNCINKPDSIRKSYWRNKLNNKKIEIMCVEIGNLENVFNPLYESLKDSEEIGNLENVFNPLYERLEDSEEIGIETINGKLGNDEWNRLSENLARIDWTGSNDYSRFC